MILSYLILFGSGFQSLEGLIWEASEGMFECWHVVPGWNDEGKEEAYGREEDIWRIEGPKMCPIINRHRCCWGIDIMTTIVHQCNMFYKLLWLECRYIAKAVWLGMFSFHMNRDCRIGELQEKVEALLKKNPSPSSEERQVHQVMSCGCKRWELRSATRRSCWSWRSWKGGRLPMKIWRSFRIGPWCCMFLGL